MANLDEAKINSSHNTDANTSINYRKENNKLTAKDTNQVKRSYNVEYLKNIRTRHCNPEQCPIIKERLQKHKQEFHGGSEALKRSSNSRGVVLSPFASIEIGNQSEKFCETPVEASKNNEDFNHSSQSLDKRPNHKNRSKVSRSSSLRSSREFFATTNGYYKHNLRMVILKWLEDIPVYPNFNDSSRNVRDNMINDLIESLYKLSFNIDKENYAKDIKQEIHTFLITIPIWYPGAKRDQMLYLNNLIEHLYENIVNLNNELVNNNINSNKETTSEKEKSRISSETDKSCSPNYKKRDANGEKDSLVENEISEWLSRITFKNVDESGEPVNIDAIKNLLMNYLSSLLKGSMERKNSKFIFLKSKIVGILHELPIFVGCPQNQNLIFNRYAEDLSNRLLAIEARDLKHNNSYHRSQDTKYDSAFCHSDLTNRSIFNINIKNDVKSGISRQIIQSYSSILGSRTEVENKLTNILAESFDIICSGDDRNIKDEIFNTLYTCCNSETEAWALVNSIVDDVKIANLNALSKSCSTSALNSPSFFRNVFVLTSEHNLTDTRPFNYPITSTPKIEKKEISKLNEEEQTYMKKVSQLINAWLNTLPIQFPAFDDKKFKETALDDLSGDIMDEIKLKQYAPNLDTSEEMLMEYVVIRWLYKFELLDNLENIHDHVAEFTKRLKDIPIPKMTRPKHGNRQLMENIKYAENDFDWEKDFIPKGIDVLEDEISIWMNEQPSEIYLNQDKDLRFKIVHDLALKLQDQFKNKLPEDKLKSYLSNWLEKVVKPEANIEMLTEILKQRIIKLPNDATLVADYERKMQLRDEFIESCRQTSTSLDDLNKSQIDETLEKYIYKFMEVNYKVDDPLVKGALCQLLKTEFRKLSPPTREEVNKIFANSKIHDNFPFQRLDKELQYIKDVSDWLKNLPVEGTFNTPGNKKRIEIVNALAKEICDLEIERQAAPKAMDYNLYLGTVITQYLKQLKLMPGCEEYLAAAIAQLLHKVRASRPPDLCCSRAHPNKLNDQNKTVPQNLSEFIDQYIRINGKEIADDQLKIDAWTARILKEIKEIIWNSSDPSTLCKMKVCDKMVEIPMPGDETVKHFGNELLYAKEIGHWMNNMPLLPISNSEAMELRINMISDLAEKISENDKKKTLCEDGSQSYAKLKEFVEKWILELPLDTRKEIDIPILVDQLFKRIEGKNHCKLEIMDDTKTSIPDKGSNKISQKNLKVKSFSKKQKHKSETTSKIGKSGQLVVEAIEDWCNKLPIEQNKNSAKAIKDDFARHLFQKVVELNTDPTFKNDDILYQDMLGEEIDLIFEKLSLNIDQNKKESLKTTLIEMIMKAKVIVKEKSTGQYYKQKLENTIEMSIPLPIQNKKVYDPGFEIYKNKLANMFILENFDHGNDAVKLKYETKIIDEIDKYCQEAQKRNAIPLTKDEIYNELYSALYKVPVPDENFIAQEVEEVKTRCEIDGWFEKLPLREATGLDELLEWDEILSMLSKRLHEIENNEPKYEENMKKETIKWLAKLPLQSGHEANIEKHAQELVNVLKKTKSDRKCVRKFQITDKTSKKGKCSKKMLQKRCTDLENSQINEPGNGKMETNFIPPCCQVVEPTRKPADIILEVVENWCHQLPLQGKSCDELDNIIILKNNLVTQVLIIISEVNTNPKIFNDEFLYDEYLDEELERLMKTLPVSQEFEQFKDAKKNQLKEAIKSVKPLLDEEIAKQEYKEELNKTVTSILDPQNARKEKIALLKELIEDITTNFVQYNYNREDHKGKQEYKNNVYDAVVEFILEINAGSADMDPLMKQNQLLCELAKIPVPSEDAIREHVEEIKMEKEVSGFLNEIMANGNLEKTKNKKQIQSALAKRLNDIEKNGHNCASDRLMAQEISRSLKKLDIEPKMDKIEKFVIKLKNNEHFRKAPPVVKSDVSKIENSIHINDMLKQHGWLPERTLGYNDNTPCNYEYLPSQTPEQWYTLQAPNVQSKPLVVPRPPTATAPTFAQPYRITSSTTLANPEWLSPLPLSPGHPLPPEILEDWPNTPFTEESCYHHRPTQEGSQNLSYSNSRRTVDPICDSQQDITAQGGLKPSVIPKNCCFNIQKQPGNISLSPGSRTPVPPGTCNSSQQKVSVQYTSPQPSGSSTCQELAAPPPSLTTGTSEPMLLCQQNDKPRAITQTPRLSVNIDEEPIAKRFQRRLSLSGGVFNNIAKRDAEKTSGYKSSSPILLNNSGHGSSMPCSTCPTASPKSDGPQDQEAAHSSLTRTGQTKPHCRRCQRPTHTFRYPSEEREQEKNRQAMEYSNGKTCTCLSRSRKKRRGCVFVPECWEEFEPPFSYGFPCRLPLFYF